MSKLKVGIIGASGYGGAELLRLLLTHNQVEVVGIYSRSYLGKPMHELYPGFYEISELIFSDEDALVAASDVIFASLPHGISEPIARKCADANKRFIDLGADFRLHDEADYEAWYNLPFKEKALHEQAVYGLSEIYPKQIKQANIIGNPGCYPTSIALAMYPLMKLDIDFDQHIIIDAKSGVTGAGKEPSEGSHFPNVNEAFHPYKVAEHRHTPEIEQTLSEMRNDTIHITFVPHLLPVSRGIISTVYVKLKDAIALDDIHQHYVETYQTHRFVRVLEQGKMANLKYVQYSNYCDISVHYDKRTHTLIVVSAIDNMVKGAAGQAIQNMNLMYGFAEDEGLKLIPPSF